MLAFLVLVLSLFSVECFIHPCCSSRRHSNVVARVAQIHHRARLASKRTDLVAECSHLNDCFLERRPVAQTQSLPALPQ